MAVRGHAHRHAALQSAVLGARRSISDSARDSDLVSLLRREPPRVLRRCSDSSASAKGSTVDVWIGRDVFRLDDGLRAVQHVDLLVAHGRRVPQRPGEADVRLHRRRRNARLDRRVGGDRGARAKDRRGESAARVARRCSSWRSSRSSRFRCRRRAAAIGDAPADDAATMTTAMSSAEACGPGSTQVVRSPYLLGICAFLILYTIGSTFLYFEQADIVGRYVRGPSGAHGGTGQAGARGAGADGDHADLFHRANHSLARARGDARAVARS